ncbi:hypothetical protein C4Q27_29200 [Pseudomonas sp. SWI36]|nr:hypothetical protein C4Q27_00075 [Pseudomonas sp. SWI36]AVD96215.1 hypothetical protein C4Q27_29200 [Pseudomonas sp. SWI36]
MPAKKPTRWMAPALPVFAGKPAPTGHAQNCRSGLAREEIQRGGWHRLCRCSRVNPLLQGTGHRIVGAGMPAKKPTRWMAPALPVFAGKPAPTGHRICGSGLARE